MSNMVRIQDSRDSVCIRKEEGMLDVGISIACLSDSVHGYVGGTMGGGTSPLDPIFYLHHGNIDKLWQQWEDRYTNVQSSFPNGNSGMIHYSPSDGYPFAVTPNSMLDSRSLLRPAFSGSGRNLDVWFAENGKVLLDGANGSPFVASDVNQVYTYRYTAATSPGSSTFAGSMYVGDVQNDASGNVINDSKGGFEINNNVKCNFLSGGEIVFSPGFLAKNGSQMVAKIITSPNEVAPLSQRVYQNPVLEETKEELQSPFYLKVFPNPMSEGGIIQYGINEAAMVQILLTDINGKIIKVFESEVKYPGNYRTQINVSNLSHGIYFCKIIIGKQIKVFKIIK